MNNKSWYFLFLVILFCSINLSGQISYKISSEGGLYKSGNQLNSEKSMIGIADATLNYKYSTKKKYANLNLRLRPEYYFLENPFKSFKGKLLGYFQKREASFTWNIFAMFQLYRFNYKNNNSDYYINSISGGASKPISRKTALNANIGFSSQYISSNIKQNSDFLFLSMNLKQRVSRYFSFEYGINLNKFLVSREDNRVSGEKYKNSGFRLGPTLSAKFNKGIILNFEYNFFYHSSDITTDFSYEQKFRFVLGKELYKNITVVLLTDLYLSQFNYSTEDVYKRGLYFSSELENKAVIKISYDWTKNFSLFIKSGYYKNNFVIDSSSLEGFRVLFGFQIKG